MSYIEFNDSLKVGNKLMDREHEKLISYINLLRKAGDSDESGQLIEQVAQGVVEYAKTHFFLEEEMMRVYEYPDAEAHMQAHRGFKSEAQVFVKQLEQEVEGEGQAEAADVAGMLAYLEAWLKDHILKVDVQLAEFLKDKSMA